MDPRMYPTGATPHPELTATITVGDESSNVREIAIQVKGPTGANVTQRRMILVAVLADANGDAFASTGGSTGIELGTGGNGAILAVVAKKLFICITEANGTLDLKWTDTGTEAAYLAVLQPDGKFVASAALTNA